MTTKRPKAESASEPASTVAEKPAIQTSPPRGFPIVGIGASAGGLAAIEEFLEALPASESLGMAFVLVQHLDPDHKSLLLDLVKRYTDMQVTWAKDSMEVHPGHAYLMPPNTEMVIAKGHLLVVEAQKARGLRLPIDRFFRSLAQDQHQRAVCIVLSGTGSDGTIGVREVKAEGGMIIAQTPETSGYDGMPRSAIATGLVDYILAPADMPAALLDYAARVSRSAVGAEPATPVGPPGLLEILRVVRDRTGHDFTEYKTNTMNRRVLRRMAVREVDDMGDYLALLDSDSLEAETLFRDLLIGVTSFFRDPLAFEALAEEIRPQLLAPRGTSDPVRVWVPGCSTGEEAYSIAMLLMELVEGAGKLANIQVFATDIDSEAIERARAGVYPDGISADVSPERLQRFFIQDGSQYRVSKTVRDHLVFAKQDVTKDPPFSRVDVISCRNLLIYMDPNLQQKLMPLFHYALKPGGYLLLGTSETVGGATDLFSAIDKKERLFKRREGAAPRKLMATTLPGIGARNVAPPRRQPVPARLRVRELAEKALLEKHAPACAVINADGNVLYVHGHTGRYLELPAGEPTGSLLKMARQGLRLELVSGVRKVLTEKHAVRYERLQVRADDGAFLVNLMIEPLSGPDAVEGVLLVIFEDVAAVERVEGTLEPLADREQRIADLDRELSVKEEFLRTTVEQLETSNEELKSANEEMQSTNEEMQSTNEEMETSREELQSVNEELITVNAELQQTIQELNLANSDMNNMLSGTGIGTLFVDRHLLIRRFTPTITSIMNLIPTDVGRPLGDIATRPEVGGDLVGAATRVLDTLVAEESQVESEGRTYRMRVQPYRTTDNIIEGAVITFANITEQVRLQAEIDETSALAAEAGEFAQSVLDTIREPQLVMDAALTVVTANESFLRIYGLTRDAVVGRPLGELGTGAWRNPELLERLADVLSKDERLEDWQFTSSDRSGDSEVTLNALELVRSLGKRRMVLLTVTETGSTKQ